MNIKDYNKRFGINKYSRKPTDRHLRAFSQVADIRKFEIDMYWKRASYFWTIIAVTFTGFFALSATNDFPYKNISLLLLSSMGMVFTFSWFLVNRGSKYWQENWENHLDLMEDQVTGPLYKTVLERPTKDELKSIKTDGNEPKVDKIDKYFTGPEKFSVSKINQWVALYTLTIWFILLCTVLLQILKLFQENSAGFEVIICVIILFLSALTLYLMLTKGNSYEEDQYSAVRKRKSYLIKN